MIEKYTRNLVASSGRELQKLRQSTGSEEDSEDSSVLSDSQMEQLEYTSQDLLLSLSSLTESVQKVIELERAAAVSTPRGKRLLPSQPSNSAKNLLNKSVSWLTSTQGDFSWISFNPFPAICDNYCRLLSSAYLLWCENNMDPNQTAPSVAVWLGFIVYASVIKFVWSTFEYTLKA